MLIIFSSRYCFFCQRAILHYLFTNPPITAIVIAYVSSWLTNARVSQRTGASYVWATLGDPARGLASCIIRDDAHTCSRIRTHYPPGRVYTQTVSSLRRCASRGRAAQRRRFHRRATPRRASPISRSRDEIDATELNKKYSLTRESQSYKIYIIKILRWIIN